MKNLFFTFAFLLIVASSFAKTTNVNILTKTAVVKVSTKTLKNDPTGPKSSTNKILVYCDGKPTANLSCDGCSMADIIRIAKEICG